MGLVGVVHMLRSVRLGVLLVRGCSVILHTTRTLFAPNRVSLRDFQRTGLEIGRTFGVRDWF